MSVGPCGEEDSGASWVRARRYGHRSSWTTWVLGDSRRASYVDAKDAHFSGLARSMQTGELPCLTSTQRCVSWRVGAKSDPQAQGKMCWWRARICIRCATRLRCCWRIWALGLLALELRTSGSTTVQALWAYAIEPRPPHPISFPTTSAKSCNPHRFMPLVP